MLLCAYNDSPLQTGRKSAWAVHGQEGGLQFAMEGAVIEGRMQSRRDFSRQPAKNEARQTYIYNIYTYTPY